MLQKKIRKKIPVFPSIRQSLPANATYQRKNKINTNIIKKNEIYL